MMKKLLKKSKSGGFSMTELLCVLLVMGLLTASLTVGITAAMHAYRDSVSLSEAKTLYYTLSAGLHDALCYDSSKPEVKTDNSGHITVDGQKLIPDKSYTKGLTAAVSVTEQTPEGQPMYYTVSLSVSGSGDSALVSGTFDIIPVNR